MKAHHSLTILSESIQKFNADLNRVYSHDLKGLWELPLKRKRGMLLQELSHFTMTIPFKNLLPGIAVLKILSQLKAFVHIRAIFKLYYFGNPCGPCEDQSKVSLSTYKNSC